MFMTVVLSCAFAENATSASALPAVAWSAQPSVTVEAQERSFQSGAVTLNGTLHVPKVHGRVPAVVVFHAASSPTRDAPLYRHLPEMLPPLGIAVFVFDRRGSGKSGGKLEETDYNMLADDGIAALRMLVADKRIDSRKIGFWGLSQGGWLSLLAASRISQAAFAISISAPMTTPDVQMMFASANILRIKGFSQQDIDRAMAARSALDDFMRGKRDRASTQAIIDEAATQPWFQHIYMGKTFKDPDQSRWAKEMRHDPLATLDGVKQPALVIYGAGDPWVPVQTSVDRLRATEARHPNIEVAVVAGADHAMATTVSAADQIDPVLSSNEAPDSAEYFGLLGAWLAKQGLVQAASIDCGQCEEWNEDQAPFRIFGNTYFVGPHGLSSVLITSPQGHVLIDGALPQSAPLIKRHIEQLGFKLSDVKLILSSHVHYDHVGGLAELQKMSSAKVIASDIAAPFLRSGKVDATDPQFGVIQPSPGVANVEALGNRKSIELGSLQLTVIHTPGHTPGGTSWRWKSCEEQRCLNIVYGDSLTAISDDDFKYSGDKRYPKASADLLASIAAMSAAPCDILISAHPDVAGLWSVMDEQGNGDRTKLVDPSACKRYAASAKARLEERLAQEKK
jgi:hypothetical protein